MHASVFSPCHPLTLSPCHLPMRTLSIDLGTRRVGLALSDEGGMLATPLDVLQVSSPRHAIEQILPILQRESVRRLLVGVPLEMDDTLGPAPRQTIARAKDLAAR